MEDKIPRLPHDWEVDSNEFIIRHPGVKYTDKVNSPKKKSNPGN